MASEPEKGLRASAKKISHERKETLKALGYEEKLLKEEQKRDSKNSSIVERLKQITYEIAQEKQLIAKKDNYF